MSVCVGFFGDSYGSFLCAWEFSGGGWDCLVIKEDLNLNRLTAFAKLMIVMFQRGYMKVLFSCAPMTYRDLAICDFPNKVIDYSRTSDISPHKA